MPTAVSHNVSQMSAASGASAVSRDGPRTPRKPDTVRGKADAGAVAKADPLSSPLPANHTRFVVIERCNQCHTHGTTVRHDEGKYLSVSEQLAKAITSFFDGQLQVEQIEAKVDEGARSPKLGAMEVWLLYRPAELDIDYRALRKGVTPGGPFHATLVFSKIQAKRWPNAQEVVATMKRVASIPLCMTLFGYDTGSAKNDKSPDGILDASMVPRKTALRRVDFIVTHRQGAKWNLCTNAEGKVTVDLYPGEFRLDFPPESGYDELIPGLTTLGPGTTDDGLRLNMRLETSMKKRVTVFVLDQFDKPMQNWVFRIRSLSDGLVEPVVLKTKADGKVRTHLKRGVYELAHGYVDDDAMSRSEQQDGDPMWAAAARESAVAAVRQRLEVEDSETPQVARIEVRRVRFDCEILIKTGSGEPVRDCQYVFLPYANMGGRYPQVDVTGQAMVGKTSQFGVIRTTLPPKKHQLEIQPLETMAYVRHREDIVVSEDGVVTPCEVVCATKQVEVSLYLVMPDGEPAAGCRFMLQPWIDGQDTTEHVDTKNLVTNDAGVATARMKLLEPYLFRIPRSKETQDYMPQCFRFQTDRSCVTAVVAKHIFGRIVENQIVLLLDVSGSMEFFLEEMKRALNGVLANQLCGSGKHFNVVAYTSEVVPWRPQLVQADAAAVESALAFCSSLRSGGGTDVYAAIEHAIRHPGVEAVYLISDGKGDIDEVLLNRVKQLYVSLVNRPQINTIALNCVPRKRGWKHMQALSILTRGVFRPVCLERSLQADDAMLKTMVPLQVTRDQELDAMMAKPEFHLRPSA
mmetsp:Transcript_6637/g.15901  ORF Transcript_6637/g.15901 Transcript_6637/m.15901 type:complete len:802 (-) Transcript_6637:133-2538(-)